MLIDARLRLQLNPLGMCYIYSVVRSEQALKIVLILCNNSCVLYIYNPVKFSARKSNIVTGPRVRIM